MKNYLLKGITVLFIVFLSSSAFGQSSPDLTKINEFISEVYAECPQYQNQDHINFGLDFLQRTRIHSVAVGEYPECPLLSSVGRKDKCNPSMTYDPSTFTVESFNPLKYHFNYHSTTSSYFRVDGMPFIIEILPKN